MTTMEETKFNTLLNEVRATGYLKPRVGVDLTFEQLGKLSACVYLYCGSIAKSNLEDYIKYSWVGKLF